MDKLFKLAEVASITGENLETLKTKSKRGEFPTVLFKEGNKTYKGVTAQALADLLQGKQTGGYEELQKQWEEAMSNGLHREGVAPVSSGHVEDMRWSLKKYWEALKTKKSVEGLNAANLAEVYKSYKVDEKKRKDYYGTKIQIYKAVTGFVNYLIAKGQKSESDLDKLKKLRPKRRYTAKRHSLTIEEVWAAINFNAAWTNGRTERDVAITELLIYLYAFAGCRRLEAAAVEVSGVNFAASKLLIHGKWGKDRFVPMPKELAEKIQTWLDKYRVDSDLPYLLLTHLGTQLTERSIACRFVKLSGAMKKRIRPHDLRRAYARVLANQGMKVHTIKKLMGHTTVEQTMEYIEAESEEASEFIANDFSILPSVRPEGVRNETEGVSTARVRKRSSELIV